MNTVNYYAVFGCAVLSMVIGFIWYGPLFGKKWAELIGSDMSDIAKVKEMQKKAGPLYFVQFLLTLLQVYVLAGLIAWWPEANAVAISFWMYLGFILPIVAGGSMWNNEPAKAAWTRFLLQAGYQLISVLLFGFILGIYK